MMLDFHLWFMVAGFILKLGQDTPDWKTQKNVQLQSVRNKRPTRSDLRHYGLAKEDTPHFEYVLDNILVVRPPGSEGIETARKFIIKEMENLGWAVETDAFTQSTVLGDISFANIIATLDPEAPRRLVLACHYDSKLTPTGFLGATDSAVPCSQLINLAHTMQLELLETFGQDLTLQLIFFDGEESLKNWTPTDKLYGSTHLAMKWEDMPYSHDGVTGNYLDRIDLFVLLDLLGYKNPTIYSRYNNTLNWYNRLSVIEDSLTRFRLVVRGPKIFAGSQTHEIGDDHIPFLERGVSVIHNIASPFPPVWHSMGDNRSNVDIPTVEKLNKIFRLFVAEYLNLI